MSGRAMITYLVGAVATGWLLCGMPGVANLRSKLLQSLGSFRTLRFWLLLALLGLPGGYLVLLFMALLWAGRRLWAREARGERGVETEGIGISPCE